MNKHPLSLRSERGFSLMQVVILGGIALSMTAGTLNIMDNRTQSLRLARMANRVSLLEEKVRNAAASQSAIYLSGTEHNNNTSFSRCIKNSNCMYTAYAPYELYNSFDEPVSGAFNANGKRCAAASTADCPLIVETSFQVLCANGAPACTQPDAILTKYEIKQASTSFTKGFKLKPRTGEAMLVTHMCPANEYVAGVDANGKLICEKASFSRYGLKCNNGAGFGLTDRAELRCAEVVDFCSKSLALISVIDTSGSMASGNKLGDALSAADDFLGKLTNNDEGGLASFDSSARENQKLDKDKGKARGQLKGLRAAGATNMTAGLQAAESLLAGAGGGSVQGIVFLSDGWHNVGPPPFAAADKIKAAGVKIWTIGLGEAADGNTLQRIASTPDSYAFAKDSAGLQKVYEDIAKAMCRN